jgi:peptidoglycan-N-acetylglucosamine deacetylase
MLNFRNTSIALLIFIALVAVLFLFNIRLGMFPLLAVIIYFMLLVIGSVKICMNFYLNAFCKGDTDEKVISLTFDDGPDPEVTMEVLKVLKKFKIEAAFFVIGSKAENNPDLVNQILEDGHAVGIHSYKHAFFFDLYARKKMERDLVKAKEAIDQVAGKHGGMGARGHGGMVAWEHGFLFRPPYGITNPTLARVVKRLGFIVVGWSIRSLDTTIKDPRKVAERIKKRLHPGAVVLLHDTRKDMPGILEQVIREARAQGYNFIDLKTLMNLTAGTQGRKAE